jgi:hypothetical protein
MFHRLYLFTTPVNPGNLNTTSALRTILKGWNRFTMNAFQSSMAFSGLRQTGDLSLSLAQTWSPVSIARDRFPSNELNMTVLHQHRGKICRRLGMALAGRSEEGCGIWGMAL